MEALSGACVFSICVNFDEELIVKRSDFFNRNSKSNDQFIEERTFARNPFVFEKNQPFELIITIEEQFYEVSKKIKSFPLSLRFRLFLNKGDHIRQWRIRFFF